MPTGHSAPETGRVVAPPVLDGALLRAVRQARSGIELEDSFRLIDERLRARLLNYFRAYPLCREDAEDLVQKTLERVFKAIGRLEAEEKFLPWLFAIARNVRSSAAEEAGKRLTCGSLETARELPDPATQSSFGEEGLQRERLEALENAIEKLPARQRQCLALQVGQELSYEEIAETLHLSAHTVRNHLAAARKRLQSMLAARGENREKP